MAKYYGWTNDDSLLSLSVSVEGPAFKLINFRHPEGQLERWLEELNQYYMTIILRPGKNHPNADALSRGVIQPCGPLGLTDTLEMCRDGVDTTADVHLSDGMIFRVG